MKKIAVINQKGGVGKTTSAVNIGAGLTRLGKRVMMIDLDPQSHLSFSVGIRQCAPGRSAYDLMRGTAQLADVIVPAEGMSIVPSTQDLAGLEVELAGRAGREHILREALAGAAGYDYILMDCPPTLGLLSLNALAAADEVYIPLQAEFLALQGVSRLMQSIGKVRERINGSLTVGGVFATRFDRRRGLNLEVLAALHEHYGPKLFKTIIRDNIALAEAPSFGKSIFDYKAVSHGAEDYMKLCKEIVRRNSP